MKLVARNISKEFFRKSIGSNVFYAVKEVSFSLDSGILTVLGGRSGGGKSTLLNMLSGLLNPSSGEVMAVTEAAEGSAGKSDVSESISLYSMKDPELSVFRNRHIGVVPQVQAAIQGLNVMENILLPFTIYGDGPVPLEEAGSLMRELGIESLRDAIPSELSGGEIRRMAIVRALIRNPEIILADEPTGDLDDENTEIVLEILKRRARDGAAVLLVTHEDRASAYADRIWKINAGILDTGQEGA